MPKKNAKKTEGQRHADSGRNGDGRTPIVVLDSSQTRVEMNETCELDAVRAAYYLTLSPHEWQWTQAQQESMANYVLWACQRLSAIRQLGDITFDLDHEESPA